MRPKPFTGCWNIASRKLDSSKLDARLSRVYDNPGDKQALFDDWAPSYDHDLVNELGYVADAEACARLIALIPNRQARILDAGCGTGNMALVLHQMGFNNLEGLDPSDGMLMVAKQKDIYQKLHSLFLDTKVDLPDASYDAVIAAGVLTHGHAPPESLDGILALTKPGGVIIFSLSEIASNEYGFGDKLKQLETDGAMLPLERSRLFRTYPFSAKEAHIRHWVCVYRKA